MSGPHAVPASQPGWYREPANPTVLRWWDGTSWTGFTARVPPPPWGAWAWFGFGVALTTATGASALVALFVIFGDSTSCEEPATSAQRQHGLVHLAIAAIVFAALWALPAALVRHRWRRFVAAALVTILPIAAVALSHLSVRAWTGNGFCF